MGLLKVDIDGTKVQVSDELHGKVLFETYIGALKTYPYLVDKMAGLVKDVTISLIEEVLEAEKHG